MNRRSNRTSRLFRFLQVIFAMVLMAGLGSGLRLSWLNHPDLPSWLSNTLDLLSPTGAVLGIHLTVASVVVFVFSCIVYYLIFSGKGRVIFANRASTVSALEKWLMGLLTLAVLSLCFSGIGMHNGWKSFWGGHSVYQTLHIAAAAVLFICLLFQLAILIIGIVHKSRRERRPVTVGGFWSLLGAAIVSLGLLWAFNTTMDSSHRLVSKEINRSIYIDGIIRPIEWIGSGEANYSINGREVSVHAIHDRRDLFLAIRWADPTRSTNRKMIKTETGWHEMRTEAIDMFGERVYFEDKLALSFSRSSKGCAATCHIGGENSLGRHLSKKDTLDIWNWQAISSNPAAETDDLWLGLSLSDSTADIHTDNSTQSGAYLNFNREWQEPYFLPMRAIEKDFIWIGTGMAMPYRPEQDTFKVGDQIPAILVESLIGDRGDVKAYARWSNGYWELELARQRRTGSPHDLILSDTLYLNIAIFDNAEKIHEPQLLPIQLIFE